MMSSLRLVRQASRERESRNPLHGVDVLRKAARVCCILFVLSTAQTKSQDLPAREYRAVWLTTLSGLDWPSQSHRGNPKAQQASLRRILDNIRDRGLNTVFLQVRSRGNCFYASNTEPWASELTGRLGGDPGWDPLVFAANEAHARGIELHAWVNVYKIWNGGTPPESEPRHLVRAKPEWVTRYRDEFWLDPGIPEVEDYLVRLFADLAARYDIDALHLDYVRYPDADFDDNATWRRYANGLEKSEWRRRNVDSFVSVLSKRLREIKPNLRIGAAPIGIHENIPGARGWQGFHSLAQDSRAWLREGHIDYVAPQIYWGLKKRGSGIDFEALVADWTSAAAGRHVIVGMAPYKDNIRPWIAEMIEAARRLNAVGQAYFRYGYVEDGIPFGDKYQSASIPPASTWRDRIRPNPPQQFIAEHETGGTVLSWKKPVPSADGEAARRIVIYRRSGTDNAYRIRALLPGSAESWREEETQDASSYAVSALDLCNNESDIVRSGMTAAASGRKLPAPSWTAPGPSVSRAMQFGDDLILLSYSVPAMVHVRLRLLDESGAERTLLVDGIHNPGTYLIGIERGRLDARIERYVFEAGSHRSVHSFDP